MKSDGTKRPATTRRVTDIDGVAFLPGYFDVSGQRALLSELRAVLTEAPYFRPKMPRTGKPFSVTMSNCGPLGWVSDQERGYRYQATHPVTGQPWPPMPPALATLWQSISGYPGAPEACLINFYDSSTNAATKMGSHVDRDEADFSAPVVSVSLGDDAVFHVGGAARTDPKARVTLRSGDVLMFGGPARLYHHGIDRVLPGTSMLLPEGGRINLTLRRVTPLLQPHGSTPPRPDAPPSGT